MDTNQTKIRLTSIKVKSFVTSQLTTNSHQNGMELNTDYTWVGR